MDYGDVVLSALSINPVIVSSDMKNSFSKKRKHFNSREGVYTLRYRRRKKDWLSKHRDNVPR